MALKAGPRGPLSEAEVLGERELRALLSGGAFGTCEPPLWRVVERPSSLSGGEVSISFGD